MITSEELSCIVHRQQTLEERRPAGLPRKLGFNASLLESHVLDITGVRRCGKSTVLTQMIRKEPSDWYYVNFESPLLSDFKLKDTVKLDALIDASGATRLFFDEVDQLEGWEKYIRQKLDEGYKICISGSNASLLEGELGTKLTGRHISKELFPFSYQEYLEFTHQEPNEISARTYREMGGFPRYLQTDEQIVMQELFEDIVYRDIIVHNGIREVSAVKQLVSYLVENIGCRFTASKMQTALNISSISTITQWCDWIQNAYLFFFVPICSESEKARMINPRKVYSVDTGLEYAVSSRQIPNDGARFENLVFLALRRKFKDISYYDNGAECDFIVREHHAIKSAIQACMKLTADNKEREINGLLKAMRQFSLQSGLIVTEAERDNLEQDDLSIHLVPFHEFATSLI